MYRLGVDLGGTNIVAGVVNDDYKIIGTASTKTKLPRPAEDIVADIAATAKEAVEKAGLTLDDILEVGIGSPGIANPQTGVVVYANNLDFHNLPIASMLEKLLHKKCYLGNDANAAAYGEYLAGAGRGSKNMVAITLGTGVGSGVIIDGSIYTGSNFAGGEFGHTAIAIDGEICTCGRSGCLEAYASATALIRQTKQAMLRYPSSKMWELCDNDLNNVSGRTAFEAMRMSDQPATMVVDRYIYYLSIGIANAINIFQPDVICICGGISREGDTLIEPLKRLAMGDNYARNLDDKTEIKAATLGNDAGIIGAAFLGNLQ